MLAALAQLAARMSAPTAFFGTLFIPSNRGTVSSDKFDGMPGVSYRYDRDTGILQVTSRAGDAANIVTTAHIGVDGRFRDGSGNPIGRALPGGSVIIDPAALPGYASAAAVAPGSRAAAQAQTDAADEPKLCPDPTPDHPGAREKDIAYQQYISTLINGRALSAGLAVKLVNPATGNDVFFDDCRDVDGTMIEAKGTGYAKMLANGPDSFPWLGVEQKMLKQADRQLQAAGSHTIEWYFAEPEIAEYMREKFFQNDFNIHIYYVPRE